jgi:multiple sugar transport system ATP-binding protein
MKRQVTAAAEILGLEELLDRYPRQLSGGQRQRVAMGRAIVRKPKVFLFDEPLSNLDAKLRVQMRSEIKQLHHRLGTTIIYVTHDQVEAMTMADKIVVMRGGNIEQVGAPLALYDRPANTFVAGFIGSPAMNFLPGTLSDGAVVLPGGTKLPVKAMAAPASGKVTVGVRPEDLKVAGSGIGGEIVLVEPTGSETQLLVRIGDVTATVTTRDRVGLAVGERIFLDAEPGRLHLFDDASGRRLSGERAAA